MKIFLMCKLFFEGLPHKKSSTNKQNLIMNLLSFAKYIKNPAFTHLSFVINNSSEYLLSLFSPSTVACIYMPFLF